MRFIAAIKQKELARLTAMRCSVTMKTADMLAKTFWEKRAESMENITTEHGIQARMCLSIQAERTFALLKNDFEFLRFLTRGKVNVRAELFFPALIFETIQAL